MHLVVANHRVAAPKHTTGRRAVEMPPTGKRSNSLLVFACMQPAAVQSQQVDVLLEVALMQSFHPRHDTIGPRHIHPLL